MIMIIMRARGEDGEGRTISTDRDTERTWWVLLSPLTDFKIRWADGSRLWYSLRSGDLRAVMGDALGTRHEWKVERDGWPLAARGVLGWYLRNAQEAMMR
jgi:hypothetical protein